MKNLIISIVFIQFIFFGEVNSQSNLQYSSWLDRCKDLTVAIGVGKIDKSKTEASKTKEIFLSFTIIGTGALFYIPTEPEGIPCLVTAKHIFFDPNRKPTWDPDLLFVRLSWSDVSHKSEILYQPLILKKDGIHLWDCLADSTVDLASIPFTPSFNIKDRNILSVFPFSGFANTNDIYEGAQLLILGYPGSISAEFLNSPLIRQGIIAHISPNNPENNIILIDCQIFPGNSGGPVFKIPTGFDKNGSLIFSDEPKFLGIVSQRRFEESSIYRVSSDTSYIDTSLISLETIGIGVVEPASRVRELLILMKTKYSK